MKFYSRILSINCIIALLILPCHAQAVVNHGNTASIYVPKNIALENEKLILAKQLVKLYDIKGQWFNRANHSFDSGFTQARSDSDPKVKMAIKQIDDYIAQEAINIEQEMATLYTRTYTLQELQALNKFYATPEGQTILKKNQQLSESFESIEIEHLRKMIYKFRD